MEEPVYEKNSLTLAGSVAMGTGVMIGAGIFALTGQVAELAGSWFPIAFFVAAIVSGFSAYSYIKVCNKYPSAGGIAMVLERAYGKGTVTAAAALLMALSMIINESLVARTFANYTLQLFGTEGGIAVPLLAVGLVVFAFLVNIAGNKVIGALSKFTAAIKIGGILLFAATALWATGFDLTAAGAARTTHLDNFVAGTALAILAYKGFTTITNSGAEVVHPERNVGRAIMISLVICLLVYMAVCVAVSSALTIPEIVGARDYSLAEASRPALGDYGVWFTVGIAIIATTSGILASMFAVSRMLTMLTEMKLIPHSHLGMPGDIHQHLLVYTAVCAALLAALFDLGRIAALGAIFYLLMDIIVHWGVLRHLRRDVGARVPVLITAIVLDATALAAFVAVKVRSDPLITMIGLFGIAVILAFEWFYLAPLRAVDEASGVSAD
ncbi:MAG: APC family permease [Sphingomicrobium sp.]